MGATSARSLAALVDDHGQARRELAQRREAVEVVDRERLLHELHSQLEQAGISSRAVSSVQPSLPSMRMRAFVFSRTASSRARSSAPPTLTFSTS